MKATLVLEDGSTFDGISIGVEKEAIGEVILNTAVVGYQEMMTDPSNAGQILVLTYPLIGNYGVAAKFNESNKCWIAGLVIKEASRTYSNWQAEGSFEDFLKNEEIAAAGDLDTRTLAINIRDKAEMLGIISCGHTQSKDKLLKKLRDHKNEGRKDFISKISVSKPAEISRPSSGPNIAVLDLGMLRSFARQLKTLGCGVTLLPYKTSPKDILAAKFDGLIISNGPENDAAIPDITDTVKTLLGKIAMMGISTGHEIIGLALGAKLKKMPVGHHGVNYPILGNDTFKGKITVQNHSYAIDEDTIKDKKGVTITMRNVNDRSIEEMESRTLRFVSTQYYPSSPGFDETNEVFARFLKIIPQRNTTGREVQHAKA